MIVSYAAGNVSDVLGRLVAERLAAKWGQPVVVENRPGMGGSLGAAVVNKADRTDIHCFSRPSPPWL
jgi:tripartite-type tricarboxylate transporter receptor subunit TctC